MYLIYKFLLIILSIFFLSNSHAGTVLSNKDNLTAEEIQILQNLCANEQKYSNVWYSNKCDTINNHNISKDIDHSIFVKKGLKKKNIESYSYIFSSSEHEVDGKKKIGYFVGFTKFKKNKNGVGKVFFISKQSSKPDYECSFKSYYDKDSKNFINETGDVSIKCPDYKYTGLYVKQGSKSGTGRLRLINKNSKSKNFKKEISIVFFPEFSKINMLKDKFLTSTEQGPLNFLLRKWGVDIKLLPSCYNTQDLARKSTLNKGWQEWSDEFLFFKAGWIYHFNAIPPQMGKCGDWIKLTYEKLYK